MLEDCWLNKVRCTSIEDVASVVPCVVVEDVVIIGEGAGVLLPSEHIWLVIEHDYMRIYEFIISLRFLNCTQHFLAFEVAL